MAQEIEKKFLVKCDCFKKEAFKATRITQGYLSSVPERTVRVRVKGEKGTYLPHTLNNTAHSDSAATHLLTQKPL